MDNSRPIDTKILLHQVKVTDEADVSAWRRLLESVRQEMEALGYSEYGKTWKPDKCRAALVDGDKLLSPSGCTLTMAAPVFNVDPAVDRALASWVVELAELYVELTPPYRSQQRRQAVNDVVWGIFKNEVGRRLRTLHLVTDQEGDDAKNLTAKDWLTVLWLPSVSVDLHAAAAVEIVQQFGDDQAVFNSRMKASILAYDVGITSWVMDTARQLGALGTPPTPPSQQGFHLSQSKAVPWLSQSLVQRINGHSYRAKELDPRQMHYALKGALNLRDWVVYVNTWCLPILFAFVLVGSAVRSGVKWWNGAFEL
ncbi:hypothetical protein FRB99_004960 [Tulasnella sp. 403]|nr:hypothetical protein FRB99_004960 [Tulasnella sp. 403]